MTLTSIRAYVTNFLKANLSGAGSGEWTTAEVDQYIRDGELEMFVMVADKHEDFFRTTGNLSEAANTALISLPVNTYRVLKLERVIGNGASTAMPVPLGVVARTVNEERMARGWSYPQNISTAAAPMYYSLHGQKQVELFPTPTAAQTNSLLLTYVYRPAAMATGTDTPFQVTAGASAAGTDNLEEFHDIIALHALSMCLLGEESYQQHDRIKARMQERKTQLMAYLSDMQTQVSRGPNVTADEWEW